MTESRVTAADVERRDLAGAERQDRQDDAAEDHLRARSRRAGAVAGWRDATRTAIRPPRRAGP